MTTIRKTHQTAIRTLILLLTLATIAVCASCFTANAQGIQGWQISPGAVLREQISVGPDAAQTPTPDSVRFGVRSNPWQTPVPTYVCTVDNEGDLECEDIDARGALSAASANVQGGTVNGNLLVTGQLTATSFQGSSGLLGTLDIVAGLSVGGTADADVLEVTGAATIGGDLDVSGDFLQFSYPDEYGWSIIDTDGKGDYVSPWVWSFGEDGNVDEDTWNVGLMTGELYTTSSPGIVFAHLILQGRGMYSSALQPTSLFEVRSGGVAKDMGLVLNGSSPTAVTLDVSTQAYAATETAVLENVHIDVNRLPYAEEGNGGCVIGVRTEYDSSYPLRYQLSNAEVYTRGIGLFDGHPSYHPEYVRDATIENCVFETIYIPQAEALPADPYFNIIRGASGTMVIRDSHFVHDMVQGATDFDHNQGCLSIASFTSDHPISATIEHCTFVQRANPDAGIDSWDAVTVLVGGQNTEVWLIGCDWVTDASVNYDLIVADGATCHLVGCSGLTNVDSDGWGAYGAGTITGLVGGLHNELTDLQGGTTDEYYHATSAEYAEVQDILTETEAAAAYQPLSANLTDLSVGAYDGLLTAKDGSGIGLQDQSFDLGVHTHGGKTGIGKLAGSKELEVLGDAEISGDFVASEETLNGRDGSAGAPGEAGPDVLTVNGGDGGNGNTTSQPGGQGSDIAITAGDAGDAYPDGFAPGATGGGITITTGAGGIDGPAGGGDGPGGDLTLNTGAGAGSARYGNVKIAVNGGDVLVGSADSRDAGDDGGIHLGDVGTDPDPGNNTCVIYGDDVGGTTEVKVRDEANNITQISPHYPPELAPAGLVVSASYPAVRHSENIHLGLETFIATTKTVELLQDWARETGRLSADEYIVITQPIAPERKREWNIEEQGQPPIWLKTRLGTTSQ